MKLHRFSFVLSFIATTLLALFCSAQEIKSIGVPYVENYPKSLYLAGNQNWSVAKDKAGVMYFGNARGLLTFDGKYWEQYQMPNKQIVRAVAADDLGKIYTGGFGEFGYWAYKEKRLSYTSLTKLIPKPYTLKDEIWKIYVDGKKVIFQSFSTIFTYENNKISVIKGPSAYLFLHKVDKRFYIEGLGLGLFELTGGKLVP
ncbi:MAG: transcriptional regulator, partial [Chitinophagaceae bacterium]